MEPRRVLDKVERGEISVAEACALLESGPEENNPSARLRRARWFRIKVHDDDTRLAFRLPVFLLNLGLSLAALAVRLVPEKRWNEWMDRDDEDRGANHITRSQVLASIAELRRVGVAGAGVEVNDDDSQVMIRLE